MIKATYGLDAVKKAILGMKERPVDVAVNMGRNKIVSFSGILTGVYPALFTVSPYDKNFKGKISYAYSEILCGNVKIRPRQA